MLSCHRLFADRPLATFLDLVLGLFALDGSGLLLGRSRLGLWGRFLIGRRRLAFRLRGGSGQFSRLLALARLLSRLDSRSLFCRGGLDLLVLSLLLLARIDVGLVVVCRRCLLGRLFRWGCFDLLLIAPLLAGLFGLGRSDLLGGRFRLLLLIAPLLAGLLGLGRSDLLGGSRFRLLLLVAPLLAGLLGLGRSDLLGRSGFCLLLLIAPLLAGLLGLGRSDLLGGSGFCLLLLIAPLLAGLLGLGWSRLLGRSGFRLLLLVALLLFGLLCLLALRAGLRRLALGAIRLHWDERRCGALHGAECGIALQRERA
ncbi:hypothetical protein NKH81_17540 [Mesorhizobium sp. M0959]|uniref:hypothetical protein n=1 Tax=unclassified Mesorhizobium TaxID=325217 RepID=UPI003336492B